MFRKAVAFLVSVAGVNLIYQAGVNNPGDRHFFQWSVGGLYTLGILLFLTGLEAGRDE